MQTGMTVIRSVPIIAPPLPDLLKKAIRCCALSLLILFFDGLAAGQTIGNITIVHGAVTIKRPGEQEAPARRTGALLVGDVVRTTGNAAAQVALTDDSFINIAPNSSLRVNQYSFEPKEDRRTVVVRVLEGRARFIVYKKRAVSALRVESPSSLITSHGLADFVVSASVAGTEAVVLNQSIEVKNGNSLIIGNVGLGANQKVMVTEKSPPSQPVVISPEERRALLKALSVN